MQPSAVKLSYRREGEAYVGSIDGIEFDGLSFAEMMLKVHERLLVLPSAVLSIQRMERPGLLPVQVPSDMLRILRDEPSRYIQMLSIPPRRVDLTAGKKRTSRLVAGESYVMPKSSGLRAGYATLAESFGDVVYLRMQSTKIESPQTGRWITFDELESWLGLHTVTIICIGDGIAEVKVSSLLATGAERFYLPREWNTYGNWITKAQLDEMYRHFVKEREELSCPLEVTQTR